MPAARSGRSDLGLLAAVAAGGALGGLARHVLLVTWPPGAGAIPWPVLAINTTGCLLVGMLMVVVEERLTVQPWVRPLLGIGLLGGLTTFSTYTVAAVALAREGRPYQAFGYVSATLAGCLVATAVGAAIATGTTRLRRRRP